MTTEEILEEMKPLTLELDYADEALERERVEAAQAEETAEVEQRTKKEQIVSLFESGTKDIAEIVRRVKGRASYVAQVLQQAGHLDGYFDLYTTTGKEQKLYTRYFRNLLHFQIGRAHV